MSVDTGPAWVYEQNLVPAIFTPWGRELIALAAPQPGEHVLDLACGTGAVARLAAAQAAVKDAGWRPMPAAPRDAFRQEEAAAADTAKGETTASSKDAEG